MEGRDINLGQVTHTMVPPGLHLDYGMDFWTRRAYDIAPTLTSPLLSSLIDNISQLEKPEIPGKPTSFKADEGLWGLDWALLKPDALSPSHDDGMASQMPTSEGDILEKKPHGSEPLFEPDLEEVAEIIISGDDDSDLTLKVLQAASTPRSEPAQCWKQSPEDQSPRPSPPEKRVMRGDEKSMLQQEAALPTGVKMEDLLPKRYKTFTADNNWVHQV